MSRTVEAASRKGGCVMGLMVDQARLLCTHSAMRLPEWRLPPPAALSFLVWKLLGLHEGAAEPTHCMR